MANLIRSILVVVAFLAMIAVAVFQWMEIEEYEIKNDGTSHLYWSEMSHRFMLSE